MKGKIIKDKGKYFAKAVVVYVLKKYSVDPPAEVTLSEEWDWTKHACGICGVIYNTYTAQGMLNIEGRHYPVCDECLKAECPELYHELLAQREKFDASLGVGQSGGAYRT